jgi:hypothetical protein
LAGSGFTFELRERVPGEKAKAVRDEPPGAFLEGRSGGGCLNQDLRDFRIIRIMGDDGLDGLYDMCPSP